MDKERDQNKCENESYAVFYRIAFYEEYAILISTVRIIKCGVIGREAEL